MGTLTQKTVGGSLFRYKEDKENVHLFEIIPPTYGFRNLKKSFTN